MCALVSNKEKVYIYIYIWHWKIKNLIFLKLRFIITNIYLSNKISLSLFELCFNVTKILLNLFSFSDF